MQVKLILTASEYRYTSVFENESEMAGNVGLLEFILKVIQLILHVFKLYKSYFSLKKKAHLLFSY